MKINSTPLVSVILPVYNGEKFLHEAINSILAQSFENFELLIINDGSTDKSHQIILSYTDPRIKYIQKESNSGLVKSLNTGIQIAKGTYIARMDADDIAVQNRLQKQVDFLENHPDYGLLGTNAKAINEHGVFLANIIYPETNEIIKKQMLVLSPFGHYSVMFRKSILIGNNIYYDENFKHAEDYALWVNLSAYTKFYNLNEYLMFYRSHSSSISVIHRDTQQTNRNRIREFYLNTLLPEENIFKEFYKYSYKQRVERLLTYKNKFSQQFLTHKDQLLQLMYLDGLELVKSHGIKTAWYFSQLSIEKRVIFILKHYFRGNK